MPHIVWTIGRHIVGGFTDAPYIRIVLYLSSNEKQEAVKLFEWYVNNKLLIHIVIQWTQLSEIGKSFKKLDEFFSKVVNTSISIVYSITNFTAKELLRTVTNSSLLTS